MSAGRRRSLRALWRFLAPDVRPQRALIAGGFVAMFAEVAFRILEPWPLKVVIDAVVAPGAAASPGIASLLLACACAVLLAAGMRALSSYLMTVCFALAGTRAMNAVRGRVYAHALRLSLRFHAGTRSGDVLNRLVGDVGKLRDVAVTAAMPLIGNCVTLVAMLTVMLVLDWRLGLVILACVPVFLLASHVATRRITRASRVQRAREGDLAGTAGETFGAMKVVQAYALERGLTRRFESSNDRELTEGVRATRLAAGLERSTDVLVGIATAAVLLVGGTSVLDGHLTPGELVVFVQYLKGAFKPMRDLAKYVGRIAKARASGERILDLADQAPDIADRPGATALPRPIGHVRFRGVSASYDDASLALDGVDLAVGAGERVALVGSSGSGKSTLAALLLRLQDPTRGSVEIDGVDIRDATVESVRSATAIVLQESVLFRGSIRENIRMGRPDATDEHVAWAADVACVSEFAERLPGGLDALVGERGDTLSGGQRQRIAIARAILRDARIIVLDEATAGLDPASAREVRTALRRLTEGKTTFVITHDENEAADCDRTVVLERGRIVSEAPHV
ncbi:ABC transporter transmembrane domain-containing protein [Microbacterium excoecariae]|uniref:ABC transporter transmembrane domain-containing protein n=1 Tax=Microbacterium excoecariae TaxID=2715210 RepID=UPI0014087F15|nr:ABC transporter ATP-binding protein [Microbacterium excoecariae]